MRNFQNTVLESLQRESNLSTLVSRLSSDVSPRRNADKLAGSRRTQVLACRYAIAALTLTDYGITGHD
jgi:hypothetical protein